MSYKDEDIEALFRSLDDEKTEDDFIQDDAYALQANYLSEIERLSRLHGFNKKELANKIKISPSYLTQVFNGNKPLNFITIAKIKRALNLRFYLKGELAIEKKTQIHIEDMPTVNFIPKENQLILVYKSHLINNYQDLKKITNG